MLEAALWYAARGFPVFPLHTVLNGHCSCSKPNCKAAGKHPRTSRGFKDATIDSEIIQAWWQQQPDSNIGLCTGNGLAVLDIDPRHQGDATLAALIEEFGQLPTTPQAQTGGNGSHYFFRVPMGLQGGNGLLEGIDLKAEGGYVVAAPSVHISGGVYTWLEGLNLEQQALADVPNWLLEALKTKQSSKPKTPQTEERIIEGSRNASLTSIAGTLWRRDLNCTTLENALLVINRNQCVPPLEDAEVRRIAQSVSSYTPSAQWFAMTDIGNAERFVDHHGHDVYYVTELGWFVWDGIRWVNDSTGTVQRFAKITVRRIYQDAAALAEMASNEAEGEARKSKAEIAKKLLAWARNSEGDSRMRALLNRARYEADVVASAKDFDRDDWLFNVRNGTINLRTGKLEPHSRANQITKLADVHFDPSASCPTWDAFLDKIMRYKPDLLRFIRQMVGYALTGETREQCLFMLYGTGANGKSTFIEVINAMMGDYARQADFTTFAVRSGESPRNDVARLAGARFVAATETESGQRLSEVVVKQLTGGDTVTARFLHKEFFEFKPTFKVIVATNHKPTIRNTDEGIWRRIRLVPFTVTIPVADRDQKLKEKLLQELPGILAWAVRGCLDWQAHGLIVPSSVSQATSSYRTEMDVIAAFIEDACVQDKEARVNPSDLYNTYRMWCSVNGERELAQRKFSQEIESRGFERVKSNGHRLIRGLSIRYQA